MLPDRVSNPGPLTYESGALPIALRGPARLGVCAYQGKDYNLTLLHSERPKLYTYNFGHSDCNRVNSNCYGSDIF